MQLIVQISRDYELRACAQIQDAIEFWTHRLQVPWLAWLEAGPWEWNKVIAKEQPSTVEEMTASVLNSKADSSSKVGDIFAVIGSHSFLTADRCAALDTRAIHTRRLTRASRPWKSFSPTNWCVKHASE